MASQGSSHWPTTIHLALIDQFWSGPTAHHICLWSHHLATSHKRGMKCLCFVYVPFPDPGKNPYCLSDASSFSSLFQHLNKICLGSVHWLLFLEHSTQQMQHYESIRAPMNILEVNGEMHEILTSKPRCSWMLFSCSALRITSNKKIIKTESQ